MIKEPKYQRILKKFQLKKLKINWPVLKYTHSLKKKIKIVEPNNILGIYRLDKNTSRRIDR